MLLLLQLFCLCARILLTVCLDCSKIVVDAAEGPKSQTKYVLSRALALGLKPIVVMNKCDRSDAIGKIDTGETEHKLIELFETLNATEEQKNFLTLYASARLGWITEDPLTALELADTGLTDPNEHGMKKLLNYIVSEIPEPTCRDYGGEVENDAKDESFFASDKFSMAAVTVGYDQYLGRTCTGRIVSGSIDVGDSVVVKKRSGDSITSFTPPSEISGVFIHEGISRVPLNSRAYAGDIVTLTGVPSSLAVGDTLTGSSYPVENPIITPPLAPPILAMMFGSNDGPLAGTEGAQASSAKIRDRLIAETDNNVTLKVEVAPGDAEKTIVYARGELQLGILIETMRREGFEMVISPPTILTKTDPKTGKTLEPYEEVVVDVDAEYSGTVIGALTGDRRGVVVEMSESTSDGKTQIIFHVPSRGLLGFNNEIASATKGSAVVNHLYLEDREYQPLGMGLIKGKLVNTELGKATTYALNTLQARGTLFVEPGDMLYPGMVIGENSKPGDMEVNAVRAKQVSNIRTKVVDEKAYLTPPKKMALEELIGYMDTDEIIEVTPKSIRLRKKLLDAGERERAAKAKSKQLKAEKQKKMGAR
jgi:GTP-binding protein